MLLIICLNFNYGVLSFLLTADAMDDLIPLSTLVPGQSAQVCAVLGRSDQIRRLGELGLRDGAQLVMVRHGKPCIVRLGDSKLCLRDDELLRVMVSTRQSA